VCSFSFVYFFFYHYFLFFHQENLVELKHHKLVRSIRSGTVSRDLKPNAKTRDQLNVWKMYFYFNYIIIVCLFVSFSCSPQSQFPGCYCACQLRLERMQSDHTCLDLLSLVIWSCMFLTICRVKTTVLEQSVLTLDCCHWQSVAFSYYS